MSVTVIIGAQWGDEGKGKLTHLLATNFDAVVRYQGGSNAGHTIKTGGVTYKFNLIPSGIVYQNVRCILADGMVINPQVLKREIDNLRSLNQFYGNLYISSGAHLVLPYHRLLDKYEESRRSKTIGTTGHGIGPAYADKYSRDGITVGDCLNESILREKIEYNLITYNALFVNVYNQPAVTVDEIYRFVQENVTDLLPFVCNTQRLVRTLVNENARILMEGAQGTLLDIDYGTYPMVTSSHPVSAGACLGTGIGPGEIDRIIGVSKAYATRVGNGSFPTEQINPAGDKMREAGKEYGTTTGRPRRCGWLDLVLLKYAADINSCTELALTKLDVLDDFDEIKLCISYKYQGEDVDIIDIDDVVLSQCEPVYTTLPGWKTDSNNIRKPEDLPEEIINLINVVNDHCGVKTKIISVGPSAEQIITMY